MDICTPEDFWPHKHSLYIHCYSCHMWGIPGEHRNNTICGNCCSTDTAAYYPIEKKNVKFLLDIVKEK